MDFLELGREFLNQSIEVVIIGGGPAGISAAIWCKRLGIDHLLLESETATGGQLHNIQNEIIDYPGMITNNGQQLQEKFHQHLLQLNCRFRLGTSVLSIDAANRCLTVKEGKRDPEVIHFQYLIFATGAKPRRLRIPGETEMMQRGEIYSASKDGALFAHKRVAIIGGGDRAFEGALILAENGAEVSLIHRSDRFRARREYIQQVTKRDSIQLYPHCKIERIDGKSRVTGVTIVDANGKVNQLVVDGVFIRVGVEPNSGLLKGKVEMDQNQYILHNPKYQTSEPHIFAIGDVCTPADYTSISLAAGQGMIASKSISILLS
ncbi:hypothetical protein BEP19_11520 [Ammoniphilus oxalaticus]|uniref:FAD/NAD(P)-binding domain-containing protein n=1 Tax=Ammoniphilus oxalaticus TaxID=66863 RepID=A0A419SGF7_9BACL|nr:NAD(P)/FAD-dependent oxidoreductase [Ammoniphilus oxalaticus]RKD22860.1 hypothetical protein BEP19_11520 [Ammoniphilus oxalaticus]